ncbi:MAG: TonB-dependent receptor [Bryobacteraceae bacterium]
MPSFRGAVTDPQHAVVVGAQVRVINQATGVERAVKTNNEGLYTAPFLSPGIYKITVQAPGFSEADSDPLIVTVGQAFAFNVELKVGSANEQVTVRGASELLNTTDGSVSTVIDQQFIQDMPLNGRSLQSLMALAPGVSTVVAESSGEEMSVNGQRLSSNYFTVDGVSVTNNVSKGNSNIPYNLNGTAENLTTVGTTQSMVSLEALQEFRVSTSSYSAEYGRGPGGQFSFTTRSGTNNWHGSAFDYFRNEALDAQNWFSDTPQWYNPNPVAPLPKPPERQNDFGGAFGGPVRIPHLYNGKDKTFFFFNYEGLRLMLPQPAVTYNIPSLSERAQAPAILKPILDAYPTPNGPDRGDGMAYFVAGTSNPNAIDTFALRIDHSVSDNLKLFGRFSHAPSHSTTNNPGWSNATTYANGDDSLTLGSIWLLSPTLTNEARFNFTRNTSAFQTVYQNFGLGSIDPDYSNFLGAGRINLLVTLYWDTYAQNTLTYPTTNGQNQINLVDAFSKSIGRHSFRFGVDYRRLADSLPNGYLSESVFYDSEASVLSNNTTALFNVNKWLYTLQPVYMNLSLFAQDEWKVTPRLSLSLGLRWDVNPAPKDADGHNPYTLNEISNLQTATLAPANTPLWHTDYTGFQPRLGFAYLANQTPGHETVIRGGFGIFDDTGSARAKIWNGGLGLISSMPFKGSPFPATPAMIASIPPPSITAPYNGSIFATDPNLRLPYTLQWNLAVEQALDRRDKIAVTYVGNAGRRLLLENYYVPNTPACPSSTCNIYTEVNGALSNYDAMQAQFQRQLSRGLQAIVSYTWSHALDNESNNTNPVAQTRALAFGYASSNFDIRQNLQSAITYDLPWKPENKLASAALSRWSIDARIMSSTALPVDVTSGATTVTGETIAYNPNIVPGVPLYVSSVNGLTPPGGRATNYKAFAPAYDSAGNLIEGDAGRNSARGFGGSQLDMAIRKDFHLAESVGLQFRAEAFNVLNHPQFGSVNGNLSAGIPLFGAASGTRNSFIGSQNGLYETGGPRSLQLALRLHF